VKSEEGEESEEIRVKSEEWEEEESEEIKVKSEE